MVRKIFLLRHGEAVFPEHGMDDFERPLTSKGANQVRSLGRALKDTDFRPSIVYCSGSLRTRQTLSHLSESMVSDWEVDFSEEVYEASVRTLFELLCQSDGELQQVLLIGHNPGITFLAEYLSGENVGNMAPGQLVKLDFGLGSWSELSQNSCALIN